MRTGFLSVRKYLLWQSVALSQLVVLALGSGVASAAGDACGKPKLLGIFVPWYQYLKIGKDKVTGECGVSGGFQLLPGGGQSSDLLMVGLAVVDDLIRLAGLIAVVFVVMGGIQYTTSQGNPDATAKAQSTVVNALVGLAISIVAVAFVAFIGRQIGK